MRIGANWGQIPIYVPSPCPLASGQAGHPSGTWLLHCRRLGRGVVVDGGPTFGGQPCGVVLLKIGVRFQLTFDASRRAGLHHGLGPWVSTRQGSRCGRHLAGLAPKRTKVKLAWAKQARQNTRHAPHCSPDPGKPTTRFWEWVWRPIGSSSTCGATSPRLRRLAPVSSRAGASN